MKALQLADATPDHRDRVIDLVRVSAVAVVVLGHWLLAVVQWRGGELHAENLLALEPWARRLTWVFQVMPLFFVVGGVANAASWRSARRHLTGYAGWLRGRLERLVPPVVVLVGTWTAALALASVLGADPTVLRTAARLVAMPLWFLAVYVAVVAATPAMVVLHDRFGRLVPVGLASAAALVDATVHGLGASWVGWLNFAFVWLFAHQLGIVGTDGWPGRRAALIGAGGGLTLLVVLTSVLDYPVSMVGGVDDRSNNTPPTSALVALALWQAGALALVRPRLAAWLVRRRVWATVIAANGVVMTVFLWHLTALCLVVLGLRVTDWFPQAPPASARWWLLRPVWVAALAAVLVVLVATFSGPERRRAAGQRSRLGRAASLAAGMGAGLVSAGLAGLAIGGLPMPGGRLSLPLFGLASLLAGPALVRAGTLRRSVPSGQRPYRRTKAPVRWSVRSTTQWSSMPSQSSISRSS
jgi:hypothetical protein